MVQLPPTTLRVRTSPLSAFRTWGRRRWLVAAGVAVGFALVLGLSTVLIPNPVFTRDIATVAWNYPVWLVTSVLVGLLAATYVRQDGAASAPGNAPVDPSERSSSRMGDRKSTRLNSSHVAISYAVFCLKKKKKKDAEYSKQRESERIAVSRS